VEYTINALKPRKIAVGESHQGSRRDVRPNLPPFQTTSGAAIFSSTAEDPVDPLFADGTGLYAVENRPAKCAARNRSVVDHGWMVAAG
jgi:hypothetical protein